MQTIRSGEIEKSWQLRREDEWPHWLLIEMTRIPDAAGQSLAHRRLACGLIHVRMARWVTRRRVGPALISASRHVDHLINMFAVHWSITYFGHYSMHRLALS
jgi:hypothetical protein